METNKIVNEEYMNSSNLKLSTRIKNNIPDNKLVKITTKNGKDSIEFKYEVVDIAKEIEEIREKLLLLKEAYENGF